MEACGSRTSLGRWLHERGIEATLLPAQQVLAYVANRSVPKRRNNGDLRVALGKGDILRGGAYFIIVHSDRH